MYPLWVHFKFDFSATWSLNPESKNCAVVNLPNKLSYHKTVCGVGRIVPHILKPVDDHGSASSFSRFIPEQRAPGIHWKGGWLRPAVKQNTWEKRIFSFRGLNPNSMAVQSAAVTVVTEISCPATKMRFAPTTFHVDTEIKFRLTTIWR
jgi:hypothetical protein